MRGRLRGVAADGMPGAMELGKTRMIRMLLAGVAVLGATVATARERAPAPPLAPIGKWVVEYDPKMCLLSHAYGDPAKPVTMAFRPWPMGDSVEIMLIVPGNFDEPRIGSVSVTLGGVGAAGTTVTGGYRNWQLPKKHQRITMVTIDTDATAHLADATSITVDTDRDPPVTVSPKGLKAALAALKLCDTDLLLSWGLDPAEDTHVAKPAEGDAQKWFTSDDYPAEALQRMLQGDTTILWGIDTDGRVRDCRVVAGSGDAALDKAACDGLIKRARYTPAIGLDGKPMVTHRTRHIIWRMPG